MRKASAKEYHRSNEDMLNISFSIDFDWKKKDQTEYAEISDCGCWIIGQQTIAERSWRSIRMYILMLDTRNEEQTNDVRMYIEEYLF